MNREKAEIWFEGGLLTACEIHPAPMEAGFILELRHRDGGMEPLTVAREARNKVYRTADAAIKDAGVIGFRTVTVYIPQR